MGLWHVPKTFMTHRSVAETERGPRAGAGVGVSHLPLLGGTAIAQPHGAIGAALKKQPGQRSLQVPTNTNWQQVSPLVFLQWFFRQIETEMIKLFFLLFLSFFFFGYGIFVGGKCFDVVSCNWNKESSSLNTEPQTLVMNCLWMSYSSGIAQRKYSPKMWTENK